MPKKRVMRKKGNSLTQRVKKLESSVRSEETKKHLTPYGEVSITANTSTSTGGSIPLLNLINNMELGVDGNDVSGTSYALTGIAQKWFVHNQTAVDSLFRIAIVRSKDVITSATGEDLFLGFTGVGQDFVESSESQKYYLPLNNRKYDIIMDDTIKIGKSNSSSTSQYDNNQFIKGYKRFSNRKEFMNATTDPDTKYYLMAWCIDANLDHNASILELSGTTTFYYKDN